MGGQNPNFSALKVQGVRIKRASLKSLCPHFKLNAPYRENNRQRIVKKKSISLSPPVFLNGLSCLLSFPPLFRPCDEFFALNESVEGTGEKTEEEEEEKVKGSPSPLPLL